MGNNLEEYLRKYGIKVTKPRANVLKVLFESDEALSAEDIFKQCIKNNINIDLSTVYRSLELFHMKDIIRKFDLGPNRCKYAILKRTHKHIIQCKVCHKQVEIDCPMQEIEEMIKDKTGFTFAEENLDFKLKGICGDCRKKLAEKNSL